MRPEIWDLKIQAEKIQINANWVKYLVGEVYYTMGIGVFGHIIYLKGSNFLLIHLTDIHIGLKVFLFTKKNCFSYKSICSVWKSKCWSWQMHMKLLANQQAVFDQSMWSILYIHIQFLRKQPAYSDQSTCSLCLMDKFLIGNPQAASDRFKCWFSPMHIQDWFGQNIHQVLAATSSKELAKDKFYKKLFDTKARTTSVLLYRVNYWALISLINPLFKFILNGKTHFKLKYAFVGHKLQLFHLVKEIFLKYFWNSMKMHICWLIFVFFCNAMYLYNSTCNGMW